MKIAVTSCADTLNSPIDPRFGRAPGYCIVNPETMEFEYVSNTKNVQSARGAGIQTAQKMAEQKVNVVITGNCGPKAFATLQASKIKVITGAQGTVSECIEKWKAGQLKITDSANATSHWE